MKSFQHINADSGNDEFYTPLIIIEAARRTMGVIDLDPASSEVANKRVGASRIFTIEDNGLEQFWSGRVWMNHPFGRVTNPQWINKLVSEYRGGRVSQACCITYAATSEAWFRPLLEFPQCFLHGRTDYYLKDGSIKKGVTKGSVVTYLGNSTSTFAKEFSKLGTIKITHPWGG